MKNTTHKAQYKLTIVIYILYILLSITNTSYAESIDDWFVGGSQDHQANVNIIPNTNISTKAIQTTTNAQANIGSLPDQDIMYIPNTKEVVNTTDMQDNLTGYSTGLDSQTTKIIGSRDDKTAEVSPDTKIKAGDASDVSIDDIGFYILNADSVDPYEKRPSMGNDILFKFGIPGKHLIFSKPIKITIPTLSEEGKEINIDVKHEGDKGFGNFGLSNNPNTQCTDKGGTTITSDKVKVTGGKIVFYICGASTFSLTYVGGANFANFADLTIAPGYIDKTVTFITGTHFPAGATITDVNLKLHFRPIDTENPASFGNTACYPGEKYFTLTSPAGSAVQIIRAGQLSTPSTNCPASDLIYDDQATSALGNNYGRAAGTSWRPFAALSAFNNQSPFGTWTLRMGDNAGADGVILYGYTITIVTQDPAGSLCISSPSSAISGSVTTSPSAQTIDYVYDHFRVDDQKGSSSGYYTTLSISDLTSTGGSIISKSNIQWMADPIATLSGTANASVTLAPVMNSFHVATSVDNFIIRSAGTTANIRGTYGSQLRVRVAVPAYTSIGQYTGTITYTLYEN